VFFKSKESKSTPSGAPVLEADVLRVLSQVHDPDLKRDIVSLGFVKGLEIQGGEVRFSVELTTPACPVKDQLKEECTQKVKSLPGVTSVQVTMTANVRSSTPQANRIALPSVRNVVAVASGKGGVGKSTVTVNLAVALAKSGARVGLLDADIYGPSLPLMLGTKDRPVQTETKLQPVVKGGIKLMSMGFLIADNQPVIWRGPMVHGALTQFMTQVDWGELDYLLIDMPPGTGDAQLTISQNAPLSGALIVTTPQEVSLLDARRGLMMFQSVNVPILGIIENMAGFVCPHCDTVSEIFRHGGGKKIAEEKQVPFLGSVPLDPRVADGGDLGEPIVVAHPDSIVSKIFYKLAGDVAAQLSILQAQSAGVFQPVSLQWQ
jgi:ATP-binding protein involved in chromosome partitioning